MIRARAPANMRALRRLWAAALCPAMLAACASRPVERQNNSNLVDFRQLPPMSSAKPYEVSPLEHFRMPRPLRAATPRFPAGLSMNVLPPTTMCVRVIVNAQGMVDRVEELQDRVECRVAPTPERATLLLALQEQLLQWTFVPAAICKLPPEASLAPGADPCAGTAHVEAVPVSLMYSFVFEVRDGKPTVQASGEADR